MIRGRCYTYDGRSQIAIHHKFRLIDHLLASQRDPQYRFSKARLSGFGFGFGFGFGSVLGFGFELGLGLGLGFDLPHISGTTGSPAASFVPASLAPGTGHATDPLTVGSLGRPISCL